MRDQARLAVSALGPRSFVVRRFERSPNASRAAPASLLYVGADAYAHEFGWLIAEPQADPGPPLFRGSSLGFARSGTLRSMAESADMVIRQSGIGARPAPGELVVRPFLDGHLPLEAGLQEQIARVRSKAHRRRMRAVLRSRDYRFTAGSSAADFELFYSRMYEPYVRNRFGLRAHLDTRETLAALGGTTLIVFDKDAPVCGTLLLPPTRDGVLGYHRNGFLGGGGTWSPATIARRTAALEVSVLQYAQAQGFRALDLGFTRSILNDGLFVHKRRLGCSFAAASDSPTFFIRVPPAARPRIFAALPLACVEKDGFVAHVGYERATPPLATRRWRPVVKSYAFPGVQRVVVHTDAPDGDPGRTSFELALRAALDGTPLQFVLDGDDGDAAQSKRRHR
jgi:hypothetical protein